MSKVSGNDDSMKYFAMAQMMQPQQQTGGLKGAIRRWLGIEDNNNPQKMLQSIFMAKGLEGIFGGKDKAEGEDGSDVSIHNYYRNGKEFTSTKGGSGVNIFNNFFG